MSSVEDTKRRVYPEVAAGGFSRVDGTVAFYQRINALVETSDMILDLGAGRGAAHHDDRVQYRRRLMNLKGRVKKVIGVDINEAVFQNPSLDEARLIKAGILPVETASIDLIFSDYTLEHVSNPSKFAAEVERVLKPGGWFCARTPNRYGYTSIASRLIPEAAHKRILKIAQPGRKHEDVFPAFYLLNTKRDIAKYFPPSRWVHHTYGWNSDPAYFGASRVLWQVARAAFAICPPFLATTLMVFSQKRDLRSTVE